MKVIISALDESEALKPVTSSTSVLGLEFLGKPYVYYLLENLMLTDVSEVVLILKYKSNEIKTLFPEEEFKSIKISFIDEDEISQDAESLKNILTELNETVLFINAKSFFEFDLEYAYSYHKENKNDLTIVSKEINDRRKHNFLAVNKENFVLEFINKSGWSEALTNIVNTEIYFLEPQIIKEIPENKHISFLGEFFSFLLEKNYKIKAYISNEYWHPIIDVDDYKNIQFDVLDGKTLRKPPFIAEGVFTDGNVPKGNFVIIPPVYFGEKVQIESGAVVGPFSVVGEGSLVSKGSKIRESILLKNVYVSSECSVNGTVLCDGVSVKKSANIYENCVIGENTIIGENAVVGANCLIWPNKNIENGATVLENVKYSDTNNRFMQINDVILGDFGVELTPEKTARLGAGIGSLFEGIRVGVATDGQTNSLSLKYGILGGLISVGAKSFDFGNCFYSQLFYYSSFCDIDFSIFISGGENGVSLSFCEKGGVLLSREKMRNLEMLLKRNEFNRCSSPECHDVSVMSSMEQMYINEITRQFDFSVSLEGVMFFSSNIMISNCVLSAFKRIGLKNESEKLLIKLNDSGTQITVIENGISYGHEKLLAVVAHNEMKMGNDVAMPWDAPQIITSLGESMGRRVFRFSHFNENEESVKLTGVNRLWSRDAVFLMFKLIKLLSDEKRSLKDVVADLPEFYVAKKVLEIDLTPTAISKELLKNNFKIDEGGTVVLKNEKGSVKVRGNADGKSLKILTEAVNCEIAEELITSTERLITIDIDL